ncbi:OB-fold domain-containing protein [Pseudonocardia ailaonensis]|uniref:OB-fold domain-containing protein n=1 Tax=Pseudonocardia ailaonensis TaxID=367279 RepID=A0ABN2NGZ0_9PSEU
MSGAIPALHPDRWTAPFWEAARRHELVIARCTRCDTPRPMPPGPYCWACDAGEVTWERQPGTGEVFTYTVVRQADPAYVVAVVALDGIDGVRLQSDLVGVGPDEVRIGLPVEVVWDDRDDGTTVPRFAARTT